ncbi:hypothetical protein A3A79_00940 [Candidatus Gottesmanbacteria bacterium RIFCSPLOWO2_01_FULL_43_11b]|uniref:Uncharacterized protein n=1 Tax=Candidatus Gottesmanbacteria bacterium RIFCSPLOWO2_01_FULL_43_11b TaxID=1798392 RepID=A0A1F6AHM2_9BACT|nr:MAG: hypothetical protein A3A79_00940 [Candidatus Gottesmanbacteria bacterium RIFCSPLOWO2_01_FULL_43_11b]
MASRTAEFISHLFVNRKILPIIEQIKGQQSTGWIDQLTVLASQKGRQILNDLSIISAIELSLETQAWMIRELRKSDGSMVFIPKDEKAESISFGSFIEQTLLNSHQPATRLQLEELLKI